MRLCSAKTWKSNVENIFFISFATFTWRSEIIQRGTQERFQQDWPPWAASDPRSTSGFLGRFHTAGSQSGKTSFWPPRRMSRAKSSIKSFISHTYICLYEVECRIVALKSWCQYFRPNTPDTITGLELRNFIDSFTVHGPWHGLLVTILYWKIHARN